MTFESDSSSSVVRVTRRINAQVEDVFDAWLDPNVRRNWWRIDEEGECTFCEIDARVGGLYRIGMKHALKPQGCVNSGEFLDIDRPRRLVFTWSSEDADDNIRDTTVTVEFHDLGDSTEVVLTHEGLPSDKEREAHRHGWVSVLEFLKRHYRPTGGTRNTEISL